jgi:hypothetical protein
MAQEVRKKVKGKTFVCEPSDVGDFGFEYLVDLFIVNGKKKEQISSSLRLSELDAAIDFYLTQQENIKEKNKMEQEHFKRIVDKLKSEGWS